MKFCYITFMRAALNHEISVDSSDVQQISYCVGKKLAEEAIWKFVKDEQPSFTVTNFMPPLIWGPMHQPVKDIGRINFSNGLIGGIMDSKSSEGGKVPNSAFPGCVSCLPFRSLSLWYSDGPRIC